MRKVVGVLDVDGDLYFWAGSGWRGPSDDVAALLDSASKRAWRTSVAPSHGYALAAAVAEELSFLGISNATPKPEEDIPEGALA